MTECEFCGAQLKSKLARDKHVCETMIRLDTMKTYNGKRAFDMFKMWYEIKYHSICTIEVRQFVDSGYFNTFVSNAGLMKFLHIKNPREFMQYMVDIKMSPKLWNDPGIYNLYFIHLDNQPLENHYEKSIESLTNIAEYLGATTIGEVLTKLSLHDIRELTKFWLLSPIMLIISDTLAQTYDNAPEEVQQSFAISIDLPKWIERAKNNTVMVRILKKQLIKQLDIKL